MKKVRNKKTGDIYETTMPVVFNIKTNGGGEHTVSCESIAELNEKWEDYEEPKELWSVDQFGEPINVTRLSSLQLEKLRRIGNHFDTEEETEKAVEKLKALTKLCKKGFEFNSVKMFGSGLIRIEASIPINEKTTLQERSDIVDDLYLLFGGEDK